MKNLIILLFIFTSTLASFANDGAYYSSGGIFYPMEETRISMEKEILTFTCRDSKSNVNVYFEFLNPEDTPIKTNIGFVAPLPVGDLNEDDYIHKRIQNFKVQVDGKLLPYQMKGAECSDCELMELEEMEDEVGEVLVYLFEIEFKPGITKVSHSYDFYASSNVAFQEMFSYTLTTGSKWEGKTIKDLTLEIDMDNNQYFYVSDIFQNKANWNIIGNGSVTDKYFSGLEEGQNRMIRILSGKLQIKVKDFEPQQDLEFGRISKKGFIHYQLTPDFEMTDVEIALKYRAIKGEYTKEDLRLIRNAVFAEYGYAFKSKDLKTYFSKYGWYIPDPNLKLEDIELKEEDKVFIKEIMEIEKL